MEYRVEIKDSAIKELIKLQAEIGMRIISSFEARLKSQASAESKISRNCQLLQVKNR